MILRARVSGAVAAALVAAAALVGLAAGPASAAQCTSQGGVSVVVDFNRGAGGGIRTACVENGGGKYADAIFEAAGFHLDYVNGSSFVCKVESAPADADCSATPPETAYWGLFYAKAGSAQWVYSSYGVSGLRVPTGGALSFAFQDGGDTDQPGVAPSSRSTPTPAPSPSRAPAPAPSKAPAPAPTKAPTAKPTAGSTTASPPRASRSAASASVSAAAASASASASARATASATPTEVPGESENAQAGDEPTLTATPGSPTSTEESDGLPVWVPGLGVVGLMSAAGGVAWWRRRSLVG